MATTQYRCDTCQQLYPTLAEAQACENQPFLPKLQVGDFVLGRSGFGWFDGDPAWIWNYAQIQAIGGYHGRPCPDRDSNCFGPCCTYQFLYVVTHVDRDDSRCSLGGQHRVRYHVATKAMTTGYRTGYTFDEHHITLRKLVSPPPLDWEDLRGVQAKGLL